MSDLNVMLIIGICVVSGFVVFLCLTVSVCQLISLNVEPTVVVLVDNKEIFKGSAACVNTSSMGAGTSVQIGRGWLCMWPGATYTTKNIIVKTVN